MNSVVRLLVLAVCIGAALASIAVNVTSVTLLGNQTDPHLAPQYPSRDGGSVGTVGGKIFWFWADTSYYNHTSGKMTGFYGNSGAVGTPGNPLLMNGPKRQAIPFTDTEAAFNSAHDNKPRVVLWPNSGVVEVTPGHGVMFVPKGYWGASASGEINKGMVAANVTVGSDGYANVTRLSDVPMWPEGQPLFGNLAAANDSTYIYLYSSNSIATYTATHFVARAPLVNATTLSAYEYFNNHTSLWEKTVPAVNDTSKAIMISTFGIDGNVYYSKYHGLWLLVYNYAADYKVHLRYAPTASGPWNKDMLVYTPPVPTAPNITYIYGTTGTDLYDPTGKTCAVDFTWCYPGGYANWVVQLNFA